MRKANGVPSLAAVVVESVVRDYLFAPQDSAAYRTAKKFIYGGECKHLICSECLAGDNWRTGECPPADSIDPPCPCGHGWESHSVIWFDWTEHRDVICGGAGINPEVLKEIKCTTAYTAADDSSPTST